MTPLSKARRPAIGARRLTRQRCGHYACEPVLRQNFVGGQVGELSALIRRQSQLDDHPPAPFASTPPDPLRRPPPGRSGEPRLAPATRRLHENGDPAQDSGDGSPLLGLANQDLDRVEAAPPPADLTR